MTQPPNFNMQWNMTINKHGWIRFKMGANYMHTQFSNKIFLLKTICFMRLLLIENNKNFTRLRTSSHKLTVETGRFNKTPVENRVCAFCNVGSVEDEFHLMMSCSVYENFRSTLKEYLSSFSDILSLSDEQLFPILMSCNNGDYEFTKVVCKFVNASFEKISHHLKCVDQSV